MYTMNFKQVGENIKKKLDAKGMTQQSLADLLGLSKQVMNKILNGLKAINVNELVQIANALGVSADELLKAEISSAPSSSVSFMGKVKNEEHKEKIHLIREAIDDIYFLEELLND